MNSTVKQKPSGGLTKTESVLFVVFFVALIIGGAWLATPIFSNLINNAAEKTTLEKVQPLMEEFIPIISETVAGDPQITNMMIITEGSRVSLKTITGDKTDMVALGEVAESDGVSKQVTFSVDYGFDSKNPTRFLLEGTNPSNGRSRAWTLLYDSKGKELIDGSAESMDDMRSKKLAE